MWPYTYKQRNKLLYMSWDKWIIRKKKCIACASMFHSMCVTLWSAFGCRQNSVRQASTRLLFFAKYCVVKVLFWIFLLNTITRRNIFFDFKPHQKWPSNQSGLPVDHLWTLWTSSHRYKRDKFQRLNFLMVSSNRFGVILFS